MKKSYLLLFVVLICITGFFIGVYYYYYIRVQGGPIKKSIVINGCKADYIHFITDNHYQIQKTGGHAYNNTMELGEAKTEIAKCLCDSYLNKKNTSDSIELIHILNSEEYTYVKNIFEYPVENFDTDTLHIERICKEKNKYFGRMLID